jgi:hypothetical protein
MTSPDGSTWTLRTADTTMIHPLRAIAFGNNRFIAAEDLRWNSTSSTGAVRTSTDGVSWQHKDAASPSSIMALNYCGGKFLGANYSDTLVLSADGLTWEVVKTGIGTICAFSYGNNQFVGVGNSIVTSKDGLTWESRKIGITAKLSSIAFGNGMFVAVGSSGAILVSRDALSWTINQMSILGQLSSVIFGDGKFVIAGSKGACLSSSDGITWAINYSGTEKDLNAVSFGSNQFIAVGRDGVIIRSTDGTTWERPVLPTNQDLFSVTYAKNCFYAVGAYGAILALKTDSSGSNVMLSSIEKVQSYDMKISSAQYHILINWQGTISKINANVSFYTLSGKKIFSIPTNNSTNELIVPSAMFPGHGTYIVIVSNGANAILSTQRFVFR